VEAFATFTTCMSDFQSDVTAKRLAAVFLALLLLNIVAFSGIALMQESLKWDALDCYLPWRYFVGESIQHGIFPLWNPYQHFGYPIYGDLRSVFYPEALVVGLFSGYGIHLLSALFIGYLSMAGTGMYLLAGHFTPSHPARMMAGMAYMLSGFFVGHGQEMFGIIAATWIPWTLHYFIRLQRLKQWSDLWKLALFLFLQLTGGYQALSMMLLYLLMAIFITEHFSELKNKHWASLGRTLSMHVALTLIVVCSLTVLGVTFWQVSPHILRFGGITLDDAHFMPFSPQSTISWLMPFAVSTDTAFYDTDLSMSNGHFGLLMLMALISALFRKRNRLNHVVLFFGVICLLAAFGRYTPVRAWMFAHVPLMDMFRMSAFFNYFAILAFLLVGSGELGVVLADPMRNYKRLLIAGCAMLAGILAIGMYHYVTNDVDKFQPLIFLQHYRESIGTSPRAYHVLIHAVIQSGLLLLFMAGVWYMRRNTKMFTAVLVSFLLVEMVISVKLNFPITVGSGFSPARLQSQLDANPQGFPVPDLRMAMSASPDGKQAMSPLWHNTNIFTRTASYDGFNSFRLDSFEKFREDSPEAYDHALTQPVIYFSDTVARSPTDTIIMQRFEPGHVAFHVASSTACAVTMQQTDFPGWQAFVDGIPTSHASLGIFPTLQLPKGAHRIEYHFSNRAVMLGFAISYGIFAIICMAVLFHLLRDELHLKSMGSATATLVVFSVVGGVLFVSWRSKETDMQLRHKGYAQLATTISSHVGAPRALLSIDMPHVFDSIANTSALTARTTYMREPDAQQLQAIRTQVTDAVAKGETQLLMGGYGIPADAKVRELVLQHFPSEEKLLDGRAYLSAFRRVGKYEALFSGSNDLEQPYSDWPHDMALTDTTHHHSGLRSWRVDDRQQGGPAISFALEEKGATAMRKAVLEMKVLIPSAHVGAAVYFIIERNGKPYWERTSNVRDLCIAPGVWSDFMMVVCPPFQMLPSDRIKVFVWGGNKEPLYLDDMRLSLYASP
jgi:hypothetical protein